MEGEVIPLTYIWLGSLILTSVVFLVWLGLGALALLVIKTAYRGVLRAVSPKKGKNS